jgi:hypothetical protein
MSYQWENKIRRVRKINTMKPGDIVYFKSEYKAGYSRQGVRARQQQAGIRSNKFSITTKL